MASFDELLIFVRKNTRIMRHRKNLLYTFGATKLPYVCISGGDGEMNEVIVREGEVTANRPKIMIPGRDFEFSGFDPEDAEDENSGTTIPVMVAREVKIPPANYVNEKRSVRQTSGTTESAAEEEIARLVSENDIRTGVICAPEKIWQFALLFYVGEQIARSTESNINEHFERLRMSQE